MRLAAMCPATWQRQWVLGGAAIALGLGGRGVRLPAARRGASGAQVGLGASWVSRSAPQGAGLCGLTSPRRDWKGSPILALVR